MRFGSINISYVLLFLVYMFMLNKFNSIQKQMRKVMKQVPNFACVPGALLTNCPARNGCRRPSDIRRYVQVQSVRLYIFHFVQLLPAYQITSWSL